MALQIVYSDGFGVDHPEAYARIQRIVIENPPDGSKSVGVEVTIYHKKASKNNGKAPVWGPQIFPVGVGGIDPDSVSMANAYTWLKTQALFAGAIDV